MTFTVAQRDIESRIENYSTLAMQAVTKRLSGNGRASGFSAAAAAASGNSLRIGLGSHNEHHHLEQYRYFRDWQYTAIRPVCTKIAGQQIHVASIPDRLAFAATRAAADGRLFHLKQSLPSCFKALGEDLEPIPNHRLKQALEQPNDLYVQWQLMWVSVASIEITGKCYWWIDLEAADGIPDIWYLPSHWVTPVHSGAKLFKSWQVRSPGMAEPIPVPGDRIKYFNYPDPSDPLGALSPMQVHARSIVTDDAMQESQKQSMQQGIRPSVVIKAGRLPGVTGQSGPDGQRPILTPAQRNQLLSAVKLASAGPMRHGEPFIVDGLIEDILPWMRTAQEMDWQTSGQQLKSRITQGIGTNPIIYGEIEGANRASSYVASDNFNEFKVNPLAVLFSQVMTRHIGPLFANPGERLVVWIEECRAHDAELNLRKWETAADKNWVTGNEYRKHILNIEPHDELDELEDPAEAMGTPAGPLSGEQETELAATDKRREQRRARRQAKKQLSISGPATAKTLHAALGLKGLEAVWGKSHETASDLLAKDLTAFFKMQGEAIVSDIGALAQKDAKLLAKHTGKSLASVVYSPRSWNKLLCDTARKHLLYAAKSGYAGEFALSQSAAGSSKVAISPEKEEELAGFVDVVLSQEYWSDINAHTSELLVSSLEGGMTTGDNSSLTSVTKSVWQVFVDSAATRAKEIAVTEQAGMLNHGHESAMIELAEKGIVTGKTWNVTGVNTRDTHWALKGATVSPGENFNVGGYKAPYPGYYGLPARERCNCNCWISSERAKS